MIQALAKRVDPKQTLLYVPGWRKFGYDRMYPDYEANADFPAFLAKAHELGFKVMVHCNYFGCQMENPAFQQVKDYQVRRPWDGQLDYWIWQRATPLIKFAYIDPAAKAWRDLLVSRLAELVRLTAARLYCSTMTSSPSDTR